MSQALEAQWQRALSRPSEWPEHESLENALTMTGDRLDKYKGGPKLILPLFSRQLDAMDAAIPDPGTQPMWAWNRGGLLRLMSLHLLKASPDAEALSRAQVWMAESASLRIAALDHSDAVAGMVPAAADAINTWLDAAPQPEQARIIPATVPSPRPFLPRCGCLRRANGGANGRKPSPGPRFCCRQPKYPRSPQLRRKRSSASPAAVTGTSRNSRAGNSWKI